MASKLDLALDEAIRERKKENRGKRDRSDFGTRRRDGGSIRKRDNGPRSFVRSVQNPSRRRDRRNVNSQWSHDKFADDEDVPSVPINNRLGGRLSSGSKETTELSVENLHYNVTEQDLLELFSTVGDVQKSRIKFDLSGRSTGAAFVKYANAEDAKEALKKFDGVLLDGQPMRIQIKEREQFESRGNNRGGRNNDNYRNNGGNRRNYHRSNRSNNSRSTNKNLTAEELDREMESYMSNNNDNNDMMVD